MKFYDQYGDQIGFWDKLEQLAEVYGERGIADIRRFRKRFEEKTIKNRRLCALVNPWGEIKRLRAFIDYMRDEESVAARHALDLYAENEVLRHYKELADGKMRLFAPMAEYNRLEKERDVLREKCSRIGMALDAQQKEWTEYMKKHG